MSFPVFDMHCDTASVLIGRNFRGEGKLNKNNGHIDLERAMQLPGYAQCFACFTTDWKNLPPNVRVEDVFEQQLAVILREFAENHHCVRQAFSAEDVERNRRAGLMSGILTVEGPVGFGCRAEMLDDLYRIGFRITSLGWNEKNALTGSHLTGGGLTDQGREFVKEAQSVGMLIDVSHISDEGFFDLIDITDAPILATHSNSRAVWNSSRNLTDEMFLEICRTGGVAGFNQYTDFVGERADLDTACDHILHFLELDPEGKHIALGGDLDGCDVLVDGFSDVADYPKLAGKLLQRGVGSEIVSNIYWNNALRMMSCAVPKNKK